MSTDRPDVTRDNRCKHYNGVVNKICKAGIKYEDVKVIHGPTSEVYSSLPCIKDWNESGLAKCDKCEFRTEEEIAARRAELDRLMEGIGKARQAIVDHLGGPWKRGKPGASGAIDCPVCGKKASLRFSRAGSNGHIHAACPDCVSWME